jgi:hypothetical protein
MLAAICLLSAGCSYTTDFVVINNSAQPIDVRYRIKQFPGEFSLPDKPATIAASQLDSHGGQQWKPLASDTYQVDQSTRNATVRVMPGDALRVIAMSNYRGHEDAWDANEFPVDEIVVSGGNGELKLTGSQARTTFTKVSLALYTLTYK